MPTSILSSSTVKVMLGIPGGVTRYDGAITETIAACETILVDELGLTDFTTTQYSEKIDVDDIGLNEVALEFRPVISVVALTIGGSLQALTTDYEINNALGMIKLVPLYKSFPSGRGVVDITYNAGYATTGDIPTDLKYAGHLICCSMFNQQSHVGFQSERAGNYSYSLGKNTGSTIPALAQRILGKHRRLFARGMKIQ